MTIINSKNIKKPVIYLKLLENKNLLIVDADTTVRYFDRDSLKLLHGFKLSIKHQRYKNSVVDFTNDGQYFALISEDRKEAKVYTTRTKSMIAQIDRHQGDVSCIGIEPTGNYIFASGEDGKTFVIDRVSGELVFTLPHHNDSISDIAFNKNGNLVALASYDKTISLFDFKQQIELKSLKVHSQQVVKIAFLNNNRLVSVDSRLTAIVWDISQAKVISILQGIHDDVTQFLSIKEDSFLFVATALGYIILYDLQTYKLLSKKFIKVPSAILSLEFYDEKNQLIIGTEDGNILFYNIYEGVENLKELYKQKNYKAMEKEFIANPFLEYTQISLLVEERWEKILVMAKGYLQEGDRKRAIKLFDGFKSLPQKNLIIQKLLGEYNDFEKFAFLTKKKQIALAYGVANQNPLYKNSKIYKNLEYKWYKDFQLAKKYAFNLQLDEAKKVLVPYRGLSEKMKDIQELFAQGEIYKRFRWAISREDFKVVFELSKVHLFLKRLKEYEDLMKYADKLYIDAIQAIGRGENVLAMKNLRILLDFKDFKDEVKKLLEGIEKKQKFLEAIKDEKFVLAYNLLAISKELQDTKEGIKLQEFWKRDVKEANKYAIQGDVTKIEEVLEQYFKIVSKYTLLASVFRLCYLVQIEEAMRTKVHQRDIEKGIKNYLLFFGVDNKIKIFYYNFMRNYKDSKLNLEYLQKGSFEKWKPIMIVKSILD